MVRKKILVVDEEEAIRNLLWTAFSVLDAEVLVAANAKEAFEVAAREKPIDLMVTDVMIPDMDGIDLAAKLRETRCVNHFLLLSGYHTGPMLADRLRCLGRAKFLEKPFRIPELIWIARSMLAEPMVEKRVAAVRLSGGSGPVAFQLRLTPLDRLQAACREALRLRTAQRGLRLEVESAIRANLGLRKRVAENWTDMCAVAKAAQEQRSNALLAIGA